MKCNRLECDCNIIHEELVSKILCSKPSEENFLKLSQIFKIIGDPTRIKILWSLDNNELCVCDIANILNMTKSSISHQLAILRDAQIVKYRKVGKEVYYTLDDDHISKLYEIGIVHIKHKEEQNEV